MRPISPSSAQLSFFQQKQDQFIDFVYAERLLDPEVFPNNVNVNPSGAANGAYPSHISNCMPKRVEASEHQWLTETLPNGA